MTEANTPPDGRIVGRIVAPARGPTVIFTGAIHGNEPAGVHALRRLFATLGARSPALRGEIVGLTGNCRALAAGCRFVDFDLNRAWTPANLTDGTADGAKVEHTELRELHAEILAALQRRRGPAYHIDLHTTSGDSPPFTTIADTLGNRRFALHVPVPLVLGLEEHLDGTLLTYTSTLGVVTMGFEGGRHDDARSIDRIEACAWLALAAAGALAEPEQVADVARARERLAAVARDLPTVLEVRHRHPVLPGDGFQMTPGHLGFAAVRKGETLAIDADGPVRTPESGRVLMPLYQAQGDDGFFVMREFKPFWLAVSAVLRRLHFDAMFPILPGVRRGETPGSLIIRRRVARWYAKELFHLFGYRREREEGDLLVVSRRREADQPAVAVSRSSARRASST